MAVKAIPDGYHTATPYLVMKGAAKAIEFYIKALGAQEVMRMERPDGTVGHAEIRIGDSIGMMNIAMPSIIIKMMRQKFDQQWTLRKSASTDVEQTRVLNLIRSSGLSSEVLLSGPQLLLRDLMGLETGDVLSFEFPTGRPLDLALNGQTK